MSLVGNAVFERKNFPLDELFHRLKMNQGLKPVPEELKGSFFNIDTDNACLLSFRQ